MRYQVPQFIEVESKVFGPLSFKQFIYLLGAGAIIFIIYTFLPFFFVVLIGVPVAGLGVALAFYKVNNQPFIKVIENARRHYFSPKLFLWKKQEADKNRLRELSQKGGTARGGVVQIPRFTKSNLQDLAWSLDIKEKSK